MARDKIHFAIKRALEKDGWTITYDPLHILRDETSFFIDIAARKFVTAQRN